MKRLFLLTLVWLITWGLPRTMIAKDNEKFKLGNASPTSKFAKKFKRAQRKYSRRKILVLK